MIDLRISAIVVSEMQSNLCITTKAMKWRKKIRLFKSFGLSGLLMPKTFRSKLEQKLTVIAKPETFEKKGKPK
jgi:hypothetical protein